MRRAFLRIILGSYCSVHPQQLRFRLQQFGKPSIAFPCHTGIHFSHAHSFDMGLYAFSPDQEVGIDVEKIRPLPDVLAIARSFFSYREYVFLKKLSAPNRDRAFFRMWSIKEALIKAKGWSLEKGLAACCTAGVFDNGFGRVLFDDGLVSESSVSVLDTGSDFAAALAVQGCGEYEISCRQLEDASFFSELMQDVTVDCGH
ncbi:MAG: 4'-phosphopantetheinyl transferase superfamily protein [Chlorobiaceae bacterium]|nr:4'-phosphopantetheinyl transferase superfamily protein [Chlorobiaceae bacterium]